MKFTHKIGIIGGLGPLASAYALERLLCKAATTHGALEDEEFPEVLLHSIPFRGTSACGLEHTQDVRRSLNSSIAFMREAGVRSVLVACNSSHVLLPELTEYLDIKLVSLLSAAEAQLKHTTSKTVSVLCSRSLQKTGLFNAIAERCGKKLIEIPDLPQADIDVLIYQGMLPVIAPEALKRLRRVLSNASASHTLILGCTELSRLNGGTDDRNSFVIDTLECGLDELLNRAKGDLV